MCELVSLQYPIGKYEPSATVTLPERMAALDTLAAFPQQLRAAVEGLVDEQLDTPYRPQGWTIRQVVHHVADSHMNAYARMRHAMTVNWPTIFAYDQAAWAGLPDSLLPVEGSLAILEGLHRRWVTALRAVAEEDWAARGYVHPENGRQTLGEVLPMYAWHSRHHLAQVVNCRARSGW